MPVILPIGVMTAMATPSSVVTSSRVRSSSVALGSLQLPVADSPRVKRKTSPLFIVPGPNSTRTSLVRVLLRPLMSTQLSVKLNLSQGLSNTSAKGFPLSSLDKNRFCSRFPFFFSWCGGSSPGLPKAAADQTVASSACPLFDAPF